MKPELKRYTVVIEGKEIIIETGTLAEQAGGAVTVRLGDSMMLGTATMSDEIREGVDFFPLTVDY
jgi:polyribonucleotide nucleotidyltransferase